MNFLLTLLVCAVVFKSVELYVLPIEKCSLEDSKCLLSAFQKGVPIFFNGIPELGVEKVEKMDDVEMNVAGLNFTLSNGRVKGLKNIIVDNVTWNTKKKRIHLKYHLDSTITGNYSAAGRILILPVEGNGQLKFKLKNVAMDLQTSYEIVKLQGKNYMRLLKYTFQYEVKDNAEYSLTNLFNGNQLLSETVLKFLNENWKSVSKEFGRPLQEKLSDQIFKNIGIFLEKLPLDDIAIL